MTDRTSRSRSGSSWGKKGKKKHVENERETKPTTEKDRERHRWIERNKENPSETAVVGDLQGGPALVQIPTGGFAHILVEVCARRSRLQDDSSEGHWHDPEY